MPTCRNCGNWFKNRERIDGRIINLSSRANCLECLSYKSNSRLKYRNNSKGQEITCCDCGRHYTFDAKKGHTKERCNSCVVKRKKDKTRQKALEYKGKRCERCGYDRCLWALEFHHVEEKGRDYWISTAYGRKWESLKRELDKCVLLCANCHREEHFKQRGVAQMDRAADF